MARPRARASNTLDFLDFVEEELDPRVKEQLRAALAPPIAAATLEALRSDWLDVADVHGPYITALVRLLGPEHATAAWRRYSVERLDARPAYRALVHGAIRVFGLSLGPFVQLTPKALAQGFRDCFAARTQVEERQAAVTLELAPAFARFEAYGRLLEGILLAVPDLVEETRAVLEFQADFPGRRVTARYRW